MEVNDILNERQKTHGDFKEHARITCDLKADMRYTANWDRLKQIQKEALDMIVHKIGRILAGNPNHKDHWDDIAGYATLISKELK